MIKVTLEFPSVEAAIATLGKIMGVKPPKDSAAPPQQGKPQVEATPSPASVAGATAAEPSKRGQRSDKGVKRGSYKNAAPGAEGQRPIEAPKGEPLPAAAPETAAPATPMMTETKALVSRDGESKPGAAVPTAEDAQAALSKVFETHGLPAAQHLLAEFGVSRLRDLPAEKRAEFISAATRSTAIIDIVKGNQ